MLDLNWYLPNRDAEIFLGLSLVIAVSALLLRGRSGPKLLWQLIFGFSAGAVCAPIYSLQYGVVPLWTLACFGCGVIALVCAYRAMRIDAAATSSNPFQSLDRLIERSSLVRAEYHQGHTVHAAYIAMTCLLSGIMAVVLVYAAVVCGISETIPGNRFWWTTLLAASGAVTALLAPEIFRWWSWNSEGLTTGIGPISQSMLWRDIAYVGRSKLGYWFVEGHNKKRIGWTDYTLRSDVLVGALRTARPDLDMRLL